MPGKSTKGRSSERLGQENRALEARKRAGRLKSWGTNPAELDCPKPLRMERIHRRTGEMTPYWMPCGRPKCLACGPRLFEKQCAWFAKKFSEFSDLKMVTLTPDPEIRYGRGDLWFTSRYLGNVFSSKLRARLSIRCREVGAELAYLAVLELSKAGMPHLHALLSCRLPEQVIREQAYAAGFGPVMEIEPVDSRVEAVWNVLRYILKGAFGPDRLPVGRVLWASRGLGYYGAAAKAERRQFALEQAGGAGDDFIFEPAYERRRPLPRPEPLGMMPAGQARRAKKGRWYLARSSDERRGVRHRYTAAGGYAADAVWIDRQEGKEAYSIAAKGITPDEAKRHLRGTLLPDGRGLPGSTEAEGRGLPPEKR